MSLRLYQPNTLLNRLHDEIGRMFDEGDLGIGELTAASNVWSPAVDIQEEENRYLLHVDLPGVKAEDIDITLEHGVLTLQGTRKLVSTEEKSGYRRVERMRGRFVRSFALPDTADNEKVDARLSEGVLEIVIDKKERAKPRKISIKH